MEKINTQEPLQGALRFDEPMSLHTTFKVGGPADIWVRPEGPSFPRYAACLLRTARTEGVPVFILGGGANLVVSDQGIRGIVLDTTGWSGWQIDESSVLLYAGTTVDKAVEVCADHEREALAFLAGMPGSIGGAIWMNARCYNLSISDVLMETWILNEQFEQVWVPFRPEDFEYKISPFQHRQVLILGGRFKTRPGDRSALVAEMQKYRQDRETKGHYTLPSAGSAFKNNHAFGKPTGKIIDELGLRGLSLGGAKVADWHGNIIVNTGTATAQDIYLLTEILKKRVKEALGYDLECEILFVGDWSQDGHIS
ncbi:UDP-N-acetylenolpyruvoylglucosamine reductase [Gracilinema caldarium DSM 7334]|uniref:UDP-N-acetylenolpyruvoylglucosamine reductase n=2 Tax=Gracilinema caldarium TaxID=215591 RepID=F8EX80_GRAC1|nr:UDP-N-acetylenolpyruvoylglucosamine reductase [Gracilinema caldarium DSM 7334]